MVRGGAEIDFYGQGAFVRLGKPRVFDKPD